MNHLMSFYGADHLHDVLDVGSCDINGTYRDVCSQHGLKYTGADQNDGPNVDRIMGTFSDQFDMVISGQSLEHCQNPFVLMQQICNHAKHLVIVIAPFIWAEHRYPIDCWRFLPDGMRQLVESAGWRVEEAEIDENDCFVVAVPGDGVK